MGQSPSNAFASLPEPPETVDATTILQRQIQGLGFRYYWATHNLGSETLEFRPTEASRSVIETMEHIYHLCVTVANTLAGKPSLRPVAPLTMNAETLREETLQVIAQAEQWIAAMKPEDVQHKAIVFQTPKGTQSFDFLYLMNGPLADAISHVGQIVSHRRTSGNPLESGVNVFLGVKN